MDPAAGSRQRAEQAAAGFPALLVAAQRIAATVEQGVHGRRRPGPGETFWQFRRYHAGDPASLIDWRQSGKTHPLFVRQQEWEAAESVWLWIDRSPSMDFKSEGARQSKAERALIIAIAVASLLVRGGEQIGLLGAGRAGHGTAAVDRLVERLMGEIGETGANDNKPPKTYIPRHAQLVIISDFLDPPDLWDDLIRWYVGAGVTGHMLQVLDPAEATLPYHGRVLFEGMEAEGTTTIGRVESVRDAYKARLAAQQDHHRALCSRVGWRYGVHHTDQSVETALMTLYMALADRPGHSSRQA